MSKAIIFDWHGVLDEIDYRDSTDTLADILYSSLSNKKVNIVDFRNDIFKKYHPAGCDYYANIIKPKQYWSRLLKETSKKASDESRNCMLTIRKIKNIWSNIPRLKKKYKLAILADCPKDKAIII
ncbi:hypothetical protein KKG41_01725 [Patescibacteria group bacterium]|nr:hypothetical protein [Patescibacteria group bacterium]MBU1890371.1 hypothetical protein [Patescibacteria group bacterium]